MKSIYTVKNQSGEMFEVDEDRLGEAEADGYLPVVSNGVEDFRVSRNDIQKARKDGYSPIVKQEVSKTESGLRGAAQGLTFGFADELAARGESLLTDKTYEQSLAESREAFKAAEEANPLTSLAGNIGGAIVSPVNKVIGTAVGAAKVASAVPKFLSNVARIGTEGAVAGAAIGAGVSEKESTKDLVKEALDSAETGAIFGAGLGAAGGILSKGVGLVRKSKTGKTVEDALDILKKEGVDVTEQYAATEAVSKSSKKLAKEVQEGVENIDALTGQQVGEAKKALSQTTKQVRAGELVPEASPLLEDINALKRNPLKTKDVDEVEQILKKTEVIEEAPSDLRLAAEDLLNSNKNKLTSLNEEIVATEKTIGDVTSASKDAVKAEKAKATLDRKVTSNVVKESFDEAKNKLDEMDVVFRKTKLAYEDIVNSKEYKRAAVNQGLKSQPSIDDVRILAEADDLRDALDKLSRAKEELKIQVVQNRPVARELSRGLQQSDIQVSTQGTEKLKELQQKLEALKTQRDSIKSNNVDLMRAVREENAFPKISLNEAKEFDIEKAINARRDFNNILREAKDKKRTLSEEQYNLIQKSKEFLEARINKTRAENPELVERLEKVSGDFSSMKVSQEAAKLKDSEFLGKELRDMARGTDIGSNLKDELKKTFERSPEVLDEIVKMAEQGNAKAVQALEIAKTFETNAARLTKIEDTIKNANIQGLEGSLLSKTFGSFTPMVTKGAVGAVQIKQNLDKTLRILADSNKLTRATVALAKKGGEGMSKYLSTMADLPAGRRNSAAFVLQQNPAFREFIENFNEEDEE
jgi:hypothetical protein